jgi:hypothetical protein
MMKEEQFSNLTKIELTNKANEIATNKSNFETEKEKLDIKIERLNGLLRGNESTLFGERAPIIDASISREL